jgi:hypothetical protein
MKTTSLFAAAVLAVVLFASTSNAANILFNPSFEIGHTISGGGITFLNAADPSELPGWNLHPSSGDWAWYMSSGTFGVAQDGDRFINLTSPSLSQDFAVTAGTTYTVSYFEAMRQDGAFQPDTVTTTIALAAGSATGTVLQVANNPLGNSTVANWLLFTFSFTPDTNTTATLDFALTPGSGAGYPVIDNISVTGVSAIPEPASLGLLGVGALALVRRRRVA